MGKGKGQSIIVLEKLVTIVCISFALFPELANILHNLKGFRRRLLLEIIPI